MGITEMASAPNGLKTTVIVISAHSPIATGPFTNCNEAAIVCCA